MIKTLLSSTLFIAFILISVELFKYFSYWGLGMSALLLFIVLLSALIAIIFSFILRYKKEIIFITKKLFTWIKSTKTWEAINQAMQNKYPRSYKFISNRIEKEKIFGLYFTFGVSLSLVFFLLFLSILQDLFFKDPLAMADLRIINLFQIFISGELNNFFSFFTSLGNWQTVAFLFFTITLYQIIKKSYRDALYLGFSTISGLIISFLAKSIFSRSRPPMVELIKQPLSSSLPSGHALLSICFYGFIFYLLYKHYKKNSLKFFTLLFFLLLIIFIGLSRVYLGVHYLSDVLAGWYLGFSVLLLIITIYEIRNKFYPKKINSTKKSILVVYILPATLSVLSCFFIYYSYNKIEIISIKKNTIATTINNFIETAPLYSENLTGKKMEPINFIAIGSEENLNLIFSKAGWQKSDRPNLKNILKISSAITKNITYPNAPMTPSFYDNAVNTCGFEKSSELNSARQRHHTRYWRTNYTINGKNVWVATASFDDGVEIGSIIKLPTHRISPDIDKEREFIFEDLMKTKLISEYQKINLVGEIKGINAAGDSFFTDGQAYIINL